MTVLERIFSLKFNPQCMQTKDNGKSSLTTHVFCIGNPKLSSRRDEFRAMQIILAIRCIDIESRPKGGMSSKTVSPPRFNDEVFWVGMVDIMLPVQFHYYSNSNRFSS